MLTGRLLSLTLGITLLGIPAFADFTLDFSGHSGGAVSGTASVLNTTSNIMIDNLEAIGTPNPALDGNYAVTGGGLAIHATGGSFSGGLYSYTSGTYDITGTVTGIPGATGNLLTGLISSLTVNLSTGKIILATGTDVKNAALVSFFCPTCNPASFNFTGGSTHLGSIVNATKGGAYTASTFSTDIPNDYVPEPAAVVLLGTALVLTTRLIRRRASGTPSA